MNFIQAFIKGAGFVSQSFPLLFKPGIRRFVYIPLAINTLLFIIAFYLLVHFSDSIVTAFIGERADWWVILRWLYDIIAPLLKGLLYLAMFFTVYFLFTMLANIIGAPFNSLLAKKVEDTLLQQKQDYPEIPLTKEIYLSITQEIIKMLRFAVVACLILLTLLIPVINFSFPFIWFVFMAYSLALQYIDYPLGNHSIFYKEQRQLVHRQLGTAFGFGSVINVLMLIPVLNFLVMPLAVVAATNWYIKDLKYDTVNSKAN